MKIVFASLAASAAAVDWEQYKMFYGKVFNGDEEASHKATFEGAIVEIEEQNAKGESLKFGINQFTDLTQDQFVAAAGFGFVSVEEYPGSSPILSEHVHQGEALASSLDWEHRGSVTAVKDQGQCGACWAFSTIAGLEGALKNAGGPLVSMSEQQAVDCSTQNKGCSGGNVFTALLWASSADVATEASYSYKGVQGSCKSSFSTAIPAFSINGLNRLGISGSPSVSDMKSALAQGPVSVAIQANQNSFQHYKSGILSSGCGNNLDHSVIIVGYGTDGGDEYWRLKNSWNKNWGDHGYIRLNTANNVCGIRNTQAVYPTVSTSIAI